MVLSLAMGYKPYWKSLQYTTIIMLSFIYLMRPNAHPLLFQLFVNDRHKQIDLFQCDYLLFPCKLMVNNNS